MKHGGAREISYGVESDHAGVAVKFVGGVVGRVFWVPPLTHLKWWALVDDLRTVPPGQIFAGIPRIGEFSL